MRKQKLNRSIMLIGTALIAFGLCGCTPMQDDSWEENPTDLTETVDVSEPETQPCEDNCEVSDDFLINKFSQTSETDASYTITDEDIMAMSKPGGAGKVSVKEKQTINNMESVENKVIYTSLPMPEKTTITKTTTDVIVKTTPATEITPAEATEKPTTETVKEDVKTDLKEETATETVKEGVTVEVMPIAESQLEGISNQTETTEHQMTTTAVTGKIVKETDIPLKKTVTTITETTTKVKKEKKIAADPKTLTEKVEYGDSIQEWEAKSGDTLRSLLIRWGDKAGWTVVWKLDRDYHLEAGVIFRGTFTDVSSALIRSFARATPAPIGTFYKGNRVLVITTQEDENER